MTHTQTKTAYLVTCALLLLLWGFSLSSWLSEPSRVVLLKENGIIESATVLGYALCLVFLAWKGGLSYLKKYHYAVLLVILFMLRELDFDKKFTTMGVLKSKFYVSPVVPVAEKAIGAMVIALLIYAAVQCIRRHARNLIRGLGSACAVSIGICLVLVFLAVSKSLDGIGRKLHDLGIEISSRTSDVSAALEEILELGIPVILILAAAAFFKNESRAEEKEVYRQGAKAAEERRGKG
jgi:hypothetical protein